jgi:hypothetical protein
MAWSLCLTPKKQRRKDSEIARYRGISPTASKRWRTSDNRKTSTYRPT